MAQKRRLPKDYQELEYLQSSGTQYIDTSIIGTGDEKVELKYQYHQLGSTAGGTGRIFGSRNSAILNNLSFGTKSGNLGTANDVYFFGYNKTDSGSLGPLIDTNAHIFYYDPAGFKIDNTQYWSTTPNTFTTPTNLRIFGYVNNNAMGCGIGRAYYCKIWNSNALVRNFIPARNRTTDILGMYDLCNSGKNLWDKVSSYIGGVRVLYSSQSLDATKTYTISFNVSNDYTYSSIDWLFSLRLNGAGKQNIATSSLIAGQRYSCTFTNIDLVQFYNQDDYNGTISNIMIEESSTATAYEPYPFYTNSGTGTFTAGPVIQTYDLVPESKKNILINNPNGHNLPIGYTELEYVITNGNSYLDTGIIGNNSTKIESAFTLSEKSAAGYTLFGGREAGAKKAIAFWSYVTANNASRFDFSTFTTNSVDTELDTKYTLLLESQKWYINGEVKVDHSTAASFSTPVSIYIGAMNNNGTIQFPHKGRIYRTRIWANGTNLSRDYIPARRDSDGVVGMRDIQNGVFYPSEGSEAFTAGPEVPRYVIAPLSESAVVSTRLPSGYTELEYIQNSTATSYFNTGIIPTVTDTFEYRGKKRLGYSIFGSGISQYNLTGGSTENILRIGNNSNNFADILSDALHSVKYDGTSLKVDGETIIESISKGSTLPTLTLYLFCRNHNDGPNDGAANQQISYFILSDANGVEKIHYIACERDSDNTLGFYDLVSQEFKAPAAQSYFIAGPEVHHLYPTAQSLIYVAYD